MIIISSCSSVMQVMDFSEAERQGFIKAYIEFFTELATDTRSPDELREAAEALLKGCNQHFNEQVSRIRKTKALVPVGLEDSFMELVRALHDAPTIPLFKSAADDLLQAFPAIHNWLEWWMRPKVAQMIFAAYRTMDQELWESLPASTNPEESFHYSIYTSVGQDHSVIDGLDGLYRFANAMQALDTAVLCAYLIHILTFIELICH